MMSSKPIRILVVDDHFMVRMGLSASLNVEPYMEVVAEPGNGDDALQAYRRHRPSLVLMDLRLPGMSGTDCTAAMIRDSQTHLSSCSPPIPARRKSIAPCMPAQEDTS
jgi:DNA-binding NarL/FixJ family response regulator